jgi:hypothetical protein
VDGVAPAIWKQRYRRCMYNITMGYICVFSSWIFSDGYTTYSTQITPFGVAQMYNINTVTWVCHFSVPNLPL